MKNINKNLILGIFIIITLIAISISIYRSYSFKVEVSEIIENEIVPNFPQALNYSIKGAKNQIINFTVNNDFDNLRLEERYALLKPLMDTFELKHYRILIDRGKFNWKDGVSLLPEFHVKSPEGTTIFDSLDSLRLNGELYLSGELSGELEKRRMRSELINLEPWEGMSEGDLIKTKWGPPTEIKKDRDYDVLRHDRRHKYYVWEIKNEDNKISEIREATVKQGFVTNINITELSW